MITRMIILASSESGKIITPLSYSRHWMWKTRNSWKVERCKPPSQDSFHCYCCPVLVKSPTGSSFIEWSREINDAVLNMWPALVHHQKMDLIIVILPVEYIFAPPSPATAPKMFVLEIVPRLQTEQDSTISKQLKENGNCFCNFLVWRFH